MKRLLPCICVLLFNGIAFKSESQVTRISNNTNIISGMALGNTGILVDKNGALWKTDGTPGGTLIYTSKVILDTSQGVAILNNKIYFRGNSATGKELWVTDGTDAGTNIVKDIETGSGSSSPTDIVALNNTIYFFATTTSSGKELWKSNGTSGGTEMVKDINPGTGDCYDDTYTSIFIWGSLLYFDANDGMNGLELWKSDGTSGGTVMVKDISAGVGSSNCQDFTAVGNNLFFSANDAIHGDELWKTNGTEAGTVLVKDIASGSNSSTPQQLVAFNSSQLIFETLTGIFDYSLYITDGTDAGTTLVKDYGTGGFVILYNSVIMNNKLYYTATDFGNGTEMWSTDGSPAGTSLFMDINPGNKSSTPIFMNDFFGLINGTPDLHTKLFNGKIFFMATDGTHGNELWITDGTTGNTKMVKDINPGSAGSLGNGNFSWYYTDNSFYFAANDGTTGNELHITDGTEANTSLVKDINPGSANSNPFLFLFLTNHLYFTCDDGDNTPNKDLYKIDASVTLPIKLIDFTATPDGKTVDVQWATAIENNAKDFVVQRSLDGRQFNDIGSVQANGNSTTITNYHFTDAGAYQTGVNNLYYRLQMTDVDGSSSPSNIVTVNIKNTNSLITVYPNPVKDKLVFVAGAAGNAVIKITDQIGKTVFIQQFENLQPGDTNTIMLGTTGSGVYYLQVILNGEIQTIKFVKY